MRGGGESAMTARLQTPTESMVERYLRRSAMFPASGGQQVRRYDELTGAGGTLLPGWAEIAGAMDSIGRVELAGLTSLVDRLLEDDGVTYTPVNAGQKAEAQPQRRKLDPVPLLIDAPDWTRLEAGLVQRSQLLDAVLTDIYSARRVLTSGLLPPELIFEHDHYLRQT